MQHTIHHRSARNRVGDARTGGATLIDPAVLLQFPQRSECTSECILLRNHARLGDFGTGRLDLHQRGNRQ